MAFGVIVSTNRSKEPFKRAEDEISLDDLFPESREELDRVNQGSGDRHGTWFVNSFGEVEIMVDQPWWMDYQLPREIVELLLASDATDMANLETDDPLAAMLWHEELCDVRIVINAWRNNVREVDECSVCNMMLERLFRVVGPPPPVRPGKRPILVWHHPELAATA